jgi:hypothetical protein
MHDDVGGADRNLLAPDQIVPAVEVEGVEPLLIAVHESLHEAVGIRCSTNPEGPVFVRSFPYQFGGHLIAIVGLPVKNGPFLRIIRIRRGRALFKGSAECGLCG